jgi:uncharacterized protein
VPEKQDQLTSRQRPVDTITLVVAVAAAAVSYAVGIGSLLAVRVEPAVAGVAQYLVSGLAPMVAVAIVYVVRVRRPAAIGLRAVGGRWITVAIGGGIAAIVLSILVSVVVIVIAGPPSDIQADYASASSGGPVLLALTLLAGAVLTPLGEELLFRGVVTNWLLRFGGWVAVPVSAALFALSHGVNNVLPVAFVVGVIAGLLFRATGSIWPGVVVHAIYNGYVITSTAIVAS